MDFLPEHITVITALIEERKGAFLVKTHESIDSVVDKINTTMGGKDELNNLDEASQDDIFPLDILAFRMPEIFNFINQTKGNPSVSDVLDFLANLPEQQKKFEYIRALLIEIFQRLLRIANPSIIKIGGIILSNKTMIELLILNSDPDKNINLEKLVSIGEKIALDTFNMLLTAKPLGRLGDGNIKL